MNLNCPNCGTANEPEVRFCVDCGTPLEKGFPGASAPMEDDNDRTIMSRVPLVAEEAKTVAVNQDDLAAAEAEFKPKSPPPAQMPSAAAPPPPAANGGSNQRKMIIIGVIVLLVLCCCCTLAIVGLASSDAFNEIMGTVGAITIYSAQNMV